MARVFWLAGAALAARAFVFVVLHPGFLFPLHLHSFLGVLPELIDPPPNLRGLWSHLASWRVLSPPAATAGTIAFCSSISPPCPLAITPVWRMLFPPASVVLSLPVIATALPALVILLQSERRARTLS